MVTETRGSITTHSRDSTARVTTRADHPVPLRPDERGRALSAFAALVFSGAAAMMAQIVIQKYVSVVTGGMDAFIMYSVSASFIAGLGAGSLLGAAVASRVRRPGAWWSGVEMLAGGLVVAFIPAFSATHGFVLSAVPNLLSTAAVYYAYVFLLQFATSFILATVMGANYPLAFEVLHRASSTRPSVIVATILATNGGGAAVGCALTIAVLPRGGMVPVIIIAAVGYLAAAALVLPVVGPARRPPDPRMAGGANVLPLRSAVALLFVSGAAGFTLELVLFRHFTMQHPTDPAVFAIVLCVYLGFWTSGCIVATLRPVPSQFALVALAASLCIPPILLTTRDIVAELTLDHWWLFMPLFLPVALSAFFFSVVHNEVGELDARRLARLYVSNLLGVLLGGFVAGCLLPYTLDVSFIYTLILVPPLLAAVHIACYGARPLVLLYAVAVASLAGIVFAVGPAPNLRYYTGIMAHSFPMEVRDSIAPVEDVREDWSSSVWLYAGHLWVNGRLQTPNIATPYAGLRAIQVALPAVLAHHDDIYCIGVGLGVSNGALARMLPESRIVNVDYSPALRYFWQKYHVYNFDLISRPSARTEVLDGRLGLLMGTGLFDIIMDFTVLEGAPGISTIKSYEFLSLARRRLRPGGVFIGYGRSTAYAATLQRVFGHVYKVEHAPVFVASDALAGAILDSDAARRVLAENPDLQSVLRASSYRRLLELPKLADRIVRDLDPVADYAFLLRNASDDAVDGRSGAVALF